MVGYVRVSSQEQKEQGYGLKAQKQKILQWSDFNDCQLLEIFADEGISGTKTPKAGPNTGPKLSLRRKGNFRNLQSVTF